MLDTKSKKVNKCLLNTMHNQEREHKNSSCEMVVLALHRFASKSVHIAYNIKLFATLRANFGYGNFWVKLMLLPKNFGLGYPKSGIVIVAAMVAMKQLAVFCIFRLQN